MLAREAVECIRSVYRDDNVIRIMAVADINIPQSWMIASIPEGTPLASCYGRKRSRVSSFEAGRSTFVKRRRRACPIAIGRNFPGRGCMGIGVDAARSGIVILGMSPLVRRCTRCVRTDSLVTPSSGLTDVRASNWSKCGESRSGPGAGVGFRGRAARRTCPFVISGAGRKSVGMRGYAGAFGEGQRAARMWPVVGSLISARACWSGRA